MNPCAVWLVNDEHLDDQLVFLDGDVTHPRLRTIWQHVLREAIDAAGATVNLISNHLNINEEADIPAFNQKYPFALINSLMWRYGDSIPGLPLDLARVVVLADSGRNNAHYGGYRANASTWLSTRMPDEHLKYFIEVLCNSTAYNDAMRLLFASTCRHRTFDRAVANLSANQPIDRIARPTSATVVGGGFHLEPSIQERYCQSPARDNRAVTEVERVDVGPDATKEVADVDLEQAEAILGNPAIENAAVEFVIEMERQVGRTTARDTRGHGAGDVESDGRIIEVKGFSRYGLRKARVLYITPPQLREGTENADYYVYVVENVAQGDRSKFRLRVLHGDDLLRLFAEAKVHRLYVPVRAADYARLPRMDKGGDDPADTSRGARKSLTAGEEDKRLKRNAALRAWRHEHRDHVSQYMKDWRAKRKSGT